ncbi:MAG: hypothetical protein RLO17_23360 [Cyclobacteriaceae bacterium]
MKFLALIHCFYNSNPNREKLKATLQLRVYIISCFFLGGLIGGFLYVRLDYQLNTLILGAQILLISLFYDDMRFGVIIARRKYRQKKKLH